MKLNWAERWVVNNHLRVIQQQYEVRFMKRMAPLNGWGRSLEVGCGRGAGADLILKEFRPSSLHALDLDIQMIKRARHYLPSDRRKDIHLTVADVCHLPFQGNTFHAVFGFGVLHHIPDWQQAIAEIARVLKIGGVYFFEEIYPPVYRNFFFKHLLLHPAENRFFSDDLKNALKAANLLLKSAKEVRRLGILGVAVKELKS